ncbi:MAG: exonuclease domain-containing protein [Candidatus Peribacteraceae bacterium]|nr:exonuclease domain-containing protein [Candidatus Peribacteraceae bacterium]
MSNPDNYIVFDLEASCWLGRPPKGHNEVIEIGAVKYNREMKIVDEFQAFVKPATSDKLSEFCKDLTHITQEDVDKADSFRDVIVRFQRWITDDGTKKYILLSWGKYDKNQLGKDCVLHNLDSEWLKYHINIKGKFSHVPGKKKPGMIKALKILGLEFEGTHHRGIDDARNLGRIFERDHKAMLSRSKTNLEAAVDRVFNILSGMQDEKLQDEFENHKDHELVTILLKHEKNRRITFKKSR